MNEQYLIISALSEHLYALGAPVMITSRVLERDRQTGQTVAQLAFRSLSEKPILSVTIAIQQLSGGGIPLGLPLRYQYPNLSAQRNGVFGQNIPLLLGDPQTQRIEVAVKEVVFADYSRWYDPGEPWEPLPPALQLANVSTDRELLKQYQLTVGPCCKDIYQEEKDLWYCACGTVNRKEEKTCCLCGTAAATLKHLDWPALRRQKEERLAAEQKERERVEALRRQQERLEAERREQARLEAQRKERERQEALRRAEEERLAEERRKEEERLAAQKKAEEARLIQAEKARKDAIYASAVKKQQKGSLSALEAAIRFYASIPGWKDADAQLAVCQDAVKERKTKKTQKQKKHTGNRAAAVVVVCLLAIVALAAAFVFMPEGNIQKMTAYSKACSLMEDGSYPEANALFQTLGAYRDSQVKAKLSQYQYAVSLSESGNYEEAVLIFHALGDYSDSREQANRSNYQYAASLAEAADYDKACSLLESLGDYGDSRDQLNRVRYQQALSLAKSGNHKEAIARFEELGSFEDAPEQKKAVMYDYAVLAIRDENYTEGIRCLKELDDYKDSPALLKKYQFLDAEVGSIVQFGAYEQDNNTENGPEEIEWIVLDIESSSPYFAFKLFPENQEGFLLISRFILDAKAFDSATGYHVTWEQSELRKWLNKDFLNTAFTETEQAQIPVFRVGTMGGNLTGGEASNDKVFLLERVDIGTYSGPLDKLDNETEYATVQRENAGKLAGDPNCWRLRAAGNKAGKPAYVSPAGIQISDKNDDASFAIGIRPVIWVAIPSN